MHLIFLSKDFSLKNRYKKSQFDENIRRCGSKIMTGEKIGPENILFPESLKESLVP